MLAISPGIEAPCKWPRRAGGPQYLGNLSFTLHKELKQTVLEGDFIVKLNFYSTTQVTLDFGRVLVIDIIRFAEVGCAAQHWNIAEEIADQEQIDDLC